MISGVLLASVLLVGLGSRRAVWVAAAVTSVAVGGVLLTMFLGSLVVLWIAVRRVWNRRRHAATNEVDEVVAVDCLALATTAGLPFEAAAELAAVSVGDAVSAAIRANLRAALAGRGPVSGNVVVDGAFRSAEKSKAMGSRLGPVLAARSAQLRLERSAVRKERLARLPVKLLFPLALLVLPGFMLMAVAPAVVGGLSRLGI